MISATLNQYLTLAREHGLNKRSQLLKLLDEHPSRAEVIKRLRESGGPIWRDYLDTLAAS